MKEAEAHLIKELCSAVLSGRHADARALAQRCSKPKPKGSSILRAWFDGACWPNPGGHGGYGVVVKRHDQVIYSKAVYLGHGPRISNNVAEYAGLIAVLRFLLQEGIQWATVYGDSQMVIKQQSGVFKAKRGLYLPFYQEARELKWRDCRMCVWFGSLEGRIPKLIHFLRKPFPQQFVNWYKPATLR